jgi:hydrogenase expression/formation protein HypD
VTSIGLIDQAIEIAEKEDTILCSFGDMLRVPGTRKSLLQAKAEGANVQIVYSPLDAVRMASEQPDKEVVFFAVGFETTAPANALSVVQAHKMGLTNYTILTSHVLVPPAIEAIMSDPENQVDGFLAAGHVCAIMGLDEYHPIASKYHVPIVATGFEPVDLLHGIYMVIRQLEEGRFDVENQYVRAVEAEGNKRAMSVIKDVFDISDREWRGFGNIPASGLELREELRQYDAKLKFNIDSDRPVVDNGCRAGDVLKGLIKPRECPFFGKECTPEKPMGAPMVSSEGACAAYYHYSLTLTE